LVEVRGVVVSCRVKDGGASVIIKTSHGGLESVEYLGSVLDLPQVGDEASFKKQEVGLGRRVTITDLRFERAQKETNEEYSPKGMDQDRIYFAYVDGKLYCQNTARWFDANHPRLGRGKDTLASRGKLTWKTKISGQMSVCEDPRRRR